MLFERRELRIAKSMREAGAFVQELLDIRITIAPNGTVRYGADGPGQHDDLVMAVALSCWRARSG